MITELKYEALIYSINKMMTYSTILIYSLCMLLTAMFPLPTSAEDCSLEEVRQAEMDMRNAEETGRNMKLPDAFEMASSLNIKCLMGDGASRQKI